MRFVDSILLASIPGLMFLVIPRPGMEFSFSWQLISIWIGGSLFAFFLSSWWWRLFFLSALARTATLEPIIMGYISLLMLGLFLAAAEKFSQIDQKKIINMMVAAALALMIWVTAQQLGWMTAYFGSHSIGPFNPDMGGIFLALCLPAFFRQFYCYFVLVILAGLIISHTTTGWLAAMAAVLIWAFHFSRKIFLASMFILLVLGSIWFWKIDPISETIRANRWVAWGHGIQFVRADLFGRGLGSWADTFPVMTMGDPRMGQVVRQVGQGIGLDNAWVQAHNEYVQMTFELGVPAFLLMAGFVFFTGWQILFRTPSPIAAAGIVALMVSCFGFFPLHEAPTALLGCAWLGMWHKEKQGNKNEH